MPTLPSRNLTTRTSQVPVSLSSGARRATSTTPRLPQPAEVGSATEVATVTQEVPGETLATGRQAALAETRPATTATSPAISPGSAVRERDPDPDPESKCLVRF
jgi:hypothetical protein